MLNLNIYVRKLLHSNVNDARGALAYGDGSSPSTTPHHHVKMHRGSSSLRFKMPHIPCIKPQVDFDYDFDYDDDDDENATNYQDEMSCGSSDHERRRISFLKDTEDDEEKRMSCDDEEIDLKAEEFMFYEQMKLQRQVSYLQYN
ncbi:hypothetical protein Sango_0276900 [Sesamum angolense]|uniref:Uncharacterized protein n=1 Tax=Sesamum angolense TaxID=2727404 RepID=A0AAE1X7X5_9LAMI|nr:hypothetical protein Sango_0276900 [Sesamum angolense]